MSDEQNPYQAPRAVELSHGHAMAPGAARQQVVPFASGRVLAFVAIMMVALVALASLWFARSTYRQIGVLQKAARDAATAVDGGGSVVKRQYFLLIIIDSGEIGGRTIIHLVSGITFLVWFTRAYRNLPALGNACAAHDVSGAVGWWFVPIACCIVPCQVALEMWRGSDPRNVDLKWPQKPAAAWRVGLWWAFFIWMAFADLCLCLIWLMPSTRSVGGLLAYSWAAVLADLITIPAGISAILFIRGVDRNQDERIRLVNDRANASASTSSARPLPAFLDRISSPPPVDD